MTGPVQRANITVQTADDGRLIHSFRQSTLSELDICPERGRLTMTGEMPRIETDAACLGTAAHHGIEVAIARLLEEGPMLPDQIADCMIAEFDRLAALPNFEWKKYSVKRVHGYLQSIAHEFFNGAYSQLDPIGVEIPFDKLVIYEDQHRIIEVQGTIDLLCKNLGACDWKTASDARKFKSGWGGDGWELERWAIQPTVYLQALLLLGLIDPDQESWKFTYLAFALGSYGKVEPMELSVDRHEGDFGWLADKCLAYAQLVEAELEVWPKQDNHALCSPKWCPAFDNCKGTHYAEDWPKPSLPKGVTVN